MHLGSGGACKNLLRISINDNDGRTYFQCDLILKCVEHTICMYICKQLFHCAITISRLELVGARFVRSCTCIHSQHVTVSYEGIIE